MHPHRHIRAGLARQGGFPIDTGRPTPSIALGHLPHTDQRVRPGAQQQFLQGPDRGPILFPCRLEDSVPQSGYVLLVETPIDVIPPAHDNVLGSVHLDGVQLAPRIHQVLDHEMFKGSPAHVGTLTGPTTRVGIRPVMPRRQRRSVISVAGFPLPFGHRHSLLEHPFPPRSCAPLTIGLPGQDSRAFLVLDPDGVSTFHTSDIRPDWVPSKPRDHAVLFRPMLGPRSSRAPSARGQVLPPRSTSHHRSSPSRGVIKGSLTSTRPVFSPAWCPLDGTEALEHLSRASHPADQGPVTHAGWETGDRALARSYMIGTADLLFMQLSRHVRHRVAPQRCW
jgi:hypothetical protein